jgi:hypothetical protein
MADNVTLQTGDSPVGVAYKLFTAIVLTERKTVGGINGSGTDADRKWILDTFAECLDATTQRRNWRQSS